MDTATAKNWTGPRSQLTAMAQDRDKAIARAEAAEARVKELEGALQLAEDYWMLGVLNAPTGMIQEVVRKRRAALKKGTGNG